MTGTARVVFALLLAACSSNPDDPAGPVATPLPTLDILPPSPRGPPPRLGTGAIEFVDVTIAVGAKAPAGFAVAFVDYDDDGWPDLTVGTELGLMIFQNQRNGTFANVSLRAPTAFVGAVDTTVYADVNGDGHLDLYLGRRDGPDELLVSDGQGGFSPLTNSGVPESRGVRGVSFGDVDHDGDLDLFVSVGRKPEFGYGDQGDGGGADRLLINDGSGHFTDSDQDIGGPATGETFAAALVDFDRDTWLDILVVTASASDRFYRGGPGGTFADATPTTITDRWTNLMGLAIGDFNEDGRLDVYGTDSISDTLYAQRDDGSFEQTWPQLPGDADPTAVRTGWGVVTIDLDQDGDQDLVQSLARDDVFIGDTTPRPGGFLIFEKGAGGHFEDVTFESGQAMDTEVDGKGLATADFDRDGDLDLAVMTPGNEEDGGASGLRLLRNDGARAAGKDAVLLDLRWSDWPNSYAVGAIIDVVAGKSRASRVVTAGTSYLSAVDFVQHFGLGDAATAQVTVTWPDGQTDVFETVSAGHHRITRSANAASIEPSAAASSADPLALPCDASCEYCKAICSLYDQCDALGESGVSTVFDCVVQCWLLRPPTVEACLGEIACAHIEICTP